MTEENEEDEELTMDISPFEWEEKEDGSTWVRLDFFEALQALFDKLRGK